MTATDGLTPPDSAEVNRLADRLRSHVEELREELVTAEQMLLRVRGIETFDVCTPGMRRVYDLLEKIDDPELFSQLESAIGERVDEAEEAAIRHQGTVIMAAIRGDLVAWPACMPGWRNRPEDA
jgi:hypothetical protein